MKPTLLLFVCLVVVAAPLAFLGAGEQEKGRPTYRSPLDVAFSPDGDSLAVTDQTAGEVVLADEKDGRLSAQVKLHGEPKSVVWSEGGGKLYVSECGAGTVAEIDVGSGTVMRRLEVGPRPSGVALAPRHGLLIAANKGLSSVALVDLKTGRETAHVGVVHAPQCIAIAPDESVALVGNLLPLGDARDTDHGAVVSVIDLARGTNAGDIPLPGGSTNLRDIAISPDGRWAYAVHCVGRFTLPTDHLERGWINTNALSILDLRKKKHYATALLDRIGEGAANPWGIALSEKGDRCWITLSGAQQIAEVKLAKLHRAIAGDLDREALRGLQKSSVWRRIVRNPEERTDLQNDLGALYEAGLITRRALPGNGPRGLAISPDGTKVAAAMYFSGEVLLMDCDKPERLTRIPVGRQPEADPIRRGEQVFHDARDCFQSWLSCATCHPDTRADGLNWDLLNDGIGNPKNTHTLVLSHATPPVMSLGVRASMEVASLKGFHFIQFQDVGKSDLEAVRAYLRSLRPAPSPYLEDDGTLSDVAKRGRELFEDPEVGCARCHPGPLFTDKKMHDVGTQHALDRKGAFDTPALREIWRTAPYLHDGSAATMHEVLTDYNKNDEHGKTSHLSEEQLRALCEYVLSL